MLTATHAFTACVGLLLGGYQLFRRVKGDRRHRLVGWTWVALLLYVATSSFAIRELRDGALSLLHVLSVVTLVSLVLGIIEVRRGRVVGHKAAMRGSWLGLVGALIGAVAVPDRAIPTFAVTNPWGAAAAFLTVLAVAAGVVGAAALLGRRTTLTHPGRARRRPLVGGSLTPR